MPGMQPRPRARPNSIHRSQRVQPAVGAVGEAAPGAVVGGRVVVPPLDAVGRSKGRPVGDGVPLRQQRRARSCRGQVGYGGGGGGRSASASRARGAVRCAKCQGGGGNGRAAAGAAAQPLCLAAGRLQRSHMHTLALPLLGGGSLARGRLWGGQEQHHRQQQRPQLARSSHCCSRQHNRALEVAQCSSRRVQTRASRALKGGRGACHRVWLLPPTCRRCQCPT